MSRIVGIVFKEAGKVYYFDPGNLTLNIGEKVIVKTSRGLEFGELVSGPEELPEEEIISPLKKVLRKASPKDLAQVEENQNKEKKAFKICETKIGNHELAMKLVDVEYVFDGSKIIFYFSAAERVDFRELVKDLAGEFKTRIELRQIGVRDEAKMIGGLGPCGRRLCCIAFLRDFEPISIKAAKEQDLPINPLKISGMCSRLMCCLRYEQEEYSKFNKIAPAKGSTVETPHGIGKIIEYKVPREAVVVEISPGLKYDVPLTEVSEVEKEKGSKE